jgi:hypothetical protein
MEKISEILERNNKLVALNKDPLKKVEWYGFELEATITSLGPIRQKWQCFSCKASEMITKPEELNATKCPKCGAEASANKGEGFWIRFSIRDLIIDDGSGQVKFVCWNHETTKFELGDKIHLCNGYAENASWSGSDGTKYSEFRISSGKTRDVRKV